MTHAVTTRGYSSIGVTAALSVALLLGASGWYFSGGSASGAPRTISTVYEMPKDIPEEDADGDGVPNWQEILLGTNPNNPDSDGDGISDISLLAMASTSATSSSSQYGIADELAQVLFSGYLTLKNQGAYSPERGEALATSIAEGIRPSVTFKALTQADIKTSAGISSENYRASMKKALEPLLENTDPEIGLFAQYVQTRDPSLLISLHTASEKYKQAMANTVMVIAPSNVAAIHLEVANSLGLYASSVDTLVEHADNSLETLVSLKTFNDAEARMTGAFNALGAYYVRNGYGQ